MCENEELFQVDQDVLNELPDEIRKQIEKELSTRRQKTAGRPTRNQTRITLSDELSGVATEASVVKEGTSGAREVIDYGDKVHSTPVRELPARRLWRERSDSGEINLALPSPSQVHLKKIIS